DVCQRVDFGGQARNACMRLEDGHEVLVSGQRLSWVVELEGADPYEMLGRPGGALVTEALADKKLAELTANCLLLAQSVFARTGDRTEALRILVGDVDADEVSA